MSISKFLKITLVVAAVISTVSIANAAPSLNFQRTILPEVKNTYNLGSATSTWDTIFASSTRSGYFTATSTTVASTFAGKVGIGTTTPIARLSVNPVAGDGNSFVIGSSTATRFIVDNAGLVGINAFPTTFAGLPTRLNVSGVIQSDNFIVAGANGFYTTGGVQVGSAGFASLFASSNKIIPHDGAVGRMQFITDNTEKISFSLNGGLGVGTTSPYAKLSVHAVANQPNFNTLFAVASSTSIATSTHFIVKANGTVGIGTSSPYAPLSVVGQGTGSGVLAAFVDSGNTPRALFLDNGFFMSGTTTALGRFTLAGTTDNGLLALVMVNGQVSNPIEIKSNLLANVAYMTSSGGWYGSSYNHIGGLWSLNASHGLQLGNSMAVKWGSGAGTGSEDIGLARDAAGVLRVTNGTTGIGAIRVSTTTWTNPSNTAIGVYDAFTGRMGIGTTSPYAKLSVNPIAGNGPAFVVGSSSATSLIVNNAGFVGIGTAAPTANLHVQGGNFLFQNAGALTVTINDSSNGFIPTVNLQQAGTTKGRIEAGVGLTEGLFFGTGSARIMSFGYVGTRAVAVGQNYVSTFNVAPADSMVIEGRVGIGTTTPKANFQVTANTANATTTAEFGRAGQNKGTCIKLYDEVGTAYYLKVATGGTLNLSTTNCASVTGF